MKTGAALSENTESVNGQDNKKPGNKQALKTLLQDKGHQSEVTAFIDRIAHGGETMIPFDQITNVTSASFAAVESAMKNQTITL